MFSSPFLHWLLVAAAGRMLLALLAAAVVTGLVTWLGRIPLRYNLRNLVVRWKTTLLTALAFTAVVALVTVMLAFVNGLVRMSETSGQPGNVMILSEGSTDETFSNLDIADVKDVPLQPGILREGNTPLCSAETYVVVNQPLVDPPPDRPKRRFIQVRGVDDAVLAGRIHGMSLASGTWISAAGSREVASRGDLPGRGLTTAKEVVLGAGLAREMGLDRSVAQRAQAADPKRLVVGDRLQLGDHEWVVVGVMQPSGSSFDSEVWAKGDDVRQLFGKASYTSLVVRTADAASAAKVRDFFNKDFTKAAVTAMVETEYFAGLAETSRQFLYAVMVVTAIMSVGGILGVMNTMFAAISQRTKDIGVLRIIGYARWQIVCSFLLESVAIGLIGGLLGLAIGMLSNGLSATGILTGGQGGGKFVVLQLTVDGATLMAGLLLSLGMGFLGGLLPALRAVRLKPLEALR